MSFKFPKDSKPLSQEELDKFMKPYIEQIKKEDKILKQINLSDVKKYVEKTLNNKKYIVFDTDQIDLSKPKTIKKDLPLYAYIIEDQLAKYFNVPYLIEKTNFMKYKNNVPYDEFLDDNKLNHESTSVMFSDYFIPIIINNKKYVFKSISGQGESWLELDIIDDELSKAINKYYNFEDIMKVK